MFHNLFVLLHRVRLKPPPCCSMTFRDATTTFLSLVTCQQPKRQKPPWLIATTLSPLLSKQYFASTSSNNCFQSVQDACVVRELRDISASPPFTFHLVWSKHCFAGHHKPRRREVLFWKLSSLSVALFWSHLGHHHCCQPCRPALPQADISFAILRRCGSPLSAILPLYPCPQKIILCKLFQCFWRTPARSKSKGDQRFRV